MVPRENLEESVVRTGRDFPEGGKSMSFTGTYPCPCLTMFVSFEKMGELL